jgi:hypothetical protein
MLAALRFSFAIVAFFGLTLAGLAQQTASPPEARPVLVNVLERTTGQPIRDLTKDNFLVRVNGQPVEVLDATYSAAPRRIVVLLDVSGSMNRQGDESEMDKWHIAHDAVAHLLAQTPRDVPIAMLTFSNLVRERFDFSQNRDVISNWLKRYSDRPPKLKHKEVETALLDAILDGLSLLQPVQPGDALYAVTDGGDNASHVSISQTKGALLGSGVRLFVFLLASAGTVEERTGVDLVVGFSGDSGGMTLGDPLRPSPYRGSDREIIEAFTRDLNSCVSQFWTLQIAAPVSNKERKLKLEIEDHGKPRNDVQLTYPRLLSAAK